jgi:hypothetical protein
MPDVLSIIQSRLARSPWCRNGAEKRVQQASLPPGSPREQALFDERADDVSGGDMDLLEPKFAPLGEHNGISSLHSPAVDPPLRPRDHHPSSAGEALEISYDPPIFRYKSNYRIVWRNE